MESKTLLLMFYISPLTRGIELDVAEFQRNFYLSSTGYLSISGIGLYGCARYCGLQAGCKSFTYSTEDVKCRLIEDDATTDPAQFTYKAGYFYGDRATVVSNEPLMGMCLDHDCPDYTTCVRPLSGSRVCAVTACGPTPGIPLPINAEDISLTLSPVGTIRKLQCDSGAVGFQNVTCLPSGNWSEPESYCEVSDCGNPPSVSNAILSDGNTTIGSTRTYECSPATTTSGSGDIICQPNGNWSESSLVCIPDCVIVTNMQNASTTATVAPAGTTIIYTCDVGFELAAGTGNRYCNTEGVWEALNISCTQTGGCGDPPSVFNATISSGNTTIGSSRTYECIPTSTASGSGDITCQSNRTWSEPSLVCVPDCVMVTVIDNAYTTATVAPAKSFTFYTCMPDYVNAAGTGYRYCDQYGIWGPLDLTCVHYTQSGAPDQDG